MPEIENRHYNRAHKALLTHILRRLPVHFESATMGRLALLDQQIETLRREQHAIMDREADRAIEALKS